VEIKANFGFQGVLLIWSVIIVQGYWWVFLALSFFIANKKRVEKKGKYLILCLLIGWGVKILLGMALGVVVVSFMSKGFSALSLTWGNTIIQIGVATIALYFLTKNFAVKKMEK